MKVTMHMKTVVIAAAVVVGLSLLAADKAQRGRVQPILDFIPQERSLETALDQCIQALTRPDTG